MISYVQNKKEFTTFIKSDLINQQRELEKFLEERHKKDKKWHFYGFCEVCDQYVALQMDWLHSDGIIPNYRERLVCPICRLNNRQRYIGTFLKKKIESFNLEENYHVYFMEQATDFYQYFKNFFSDNDQVLIIGSEYFGPNIKSGKLINGMRHEDARELSFSDNFFNIIISNDVFEHVPDPLKAFEECYRVLKPGGELVMTIPFNSNLKSNIKRTEILAGNKIKYLLEPIYHGNPISHKGSLVFYDFGWEVIDWLNKAKFFVVLIGLYWSYECGYLGNGCQTFFVCKR